MKKKNKNKKFNPKKRKLKDVEKSDITPEIKPKKIKTKSEKLEALLESLQIGDNKKWVSSEDEAKFCKLSLTFFLNKSPKQVRIIIDERGKGNKSVKYKTDINFDDIVFIDLDSDSKSIITRIPTLFAKGRRVADDMGNITTQWEELIAVDWQKDEVNPNSNVYKFKFKEGTWKMDNNEKIFNSDKSLQTRSKEYLESQDKGDGKDNVKEKKPKKKKKQKKQDDSNDVGKQ